MNRDVHLRLNLLNFLLNPMPKESMEKSHKQTKQTKFGAFFACRIYAAEAVSFLEPSA